jgi:hypothetical protein
VADRRFGRFKFGDAEKAVIDAISEIDAFPGGDEIVPLWHVTDAQIVAQRAIETLRKLGWARC